MIRDSTRSKYIGAKYGHMTIIEVTRNDPNNRHHYFVLCRCDCGIEKETRLSGLQQGSTISCGCVGKTIRRNANLGNTRARGEFGENARNTLYKNYQRYAKDRGIEFALTKSQFISITEQACYYCGGEPKHIKKPANSYGHHIYNGIDRVDNDVGYTVGNCVPACRPCNSAKNAVTKAMIFKLYHRLFPHTEHAHALDVSQGH